MQSVTRPAPWKFQCSFVCPWRLARNIFGITIVKKKEEKKHQKNGRNRKCWLNRSSYIINII